VNICSPPLKAQTGLGEVTRLRALGPLADGRAESPMESRMRWRFGWEDHRIGAECDGLVAHMTRAQSDADRERHNWLTEHSWRLLHFTARHVYRRQQEMVPTVWRHMWQSRRGRAVTQMPIERQSRERRSTR
jgi:very-short-patch-repair endonuclease